MIRYSILLTTSVVFFTAQAQDTSTNPAQNFDQVVRAYLTAFNSANDSTLRAFFDKYYSKEALKRVSDAERLERTKQMRSETGRLETQSIVRPGKDLAVATVRDERKNILKMEFAFEPSPPYSILRIRIERAEDEDRGSALRSESELMDSVSTLVETLSRADEFSGVVLIAKKEKTIFERATGFADKAHSIPNKIDTRFNVGSINKTFTQLAIRKLAEQGELNLDDTIDKYLPDYPNKEAATKVTIAHLLNMSSGIGDVFGERYRNTPKEEIRSIRDYLPLFADLPLAFKPGTQRQYSNGGYIVLGAIIEKITGMEYYAYIRETIYKPAGMLNSDWYPKSEEVENRAEGYTQTEGGNRIRNVETLPGRGSSAGGGYSTAHDLLNYTKALGEKRIGAKGYDGAGGLGIAGGAPGLNAALEWQPDSGYTVVVLSNYDPPSAERVARRIRSWLPEPGK